MESFIIFLCFVGGRGDGRVGQDRDEQVGHYRDKQLGYFRDGRIISPFSVVQFPNTDCISNEGIAGECYTSGQCLARGGSSTSTCAAGFGVCCYNIVTSCSGTVDITQNNTYIRNPGYSGTYSTAGTCSYKICKVKSDVGFIRLDFETMSLVTPTSGTTADGGCATDTLTIKEGVDRTGVLHPPVYCGIGTGQHMYLNAEEGTDLCATIDILLGTSTTDRTWNIRVSQIPCGVNYAPPSTECLQYHTGTRGI